MVNTVEVYGRKKHVDIHREPFGNLKHAITITSLPPSFARYKNVWPTTIHNEGPKLVIGTLTLNALITSSIRVDCTVPPSVGPTSDITLGTADESRGTRIFLDKECVTLALDIMNKKSASIYPHDYANQLRQNPVAYIFSHIAHCVLMHGKDAQLKKSTVQKAWEDSSAKDKIQPILDLMAVEDAIPILGNMDLNRLLQPLAAALSSSICHANKSVLHAI
ncbi:hypothetical protein DM01DRAFT_1364640 [Hesseltinella vesiculosa]|uniref:Uncharacterized protein n=1 Tax=Hesseltinella vesiculosa TaxID=101127 RepID=A0A1X2G554_9FUNG|nr:hypothetical protein DM01DRAFT_1364640 [Hesseltinella vesiculosa]